MEVQPSETFYHLSTELEYHMIPILVAIFVCSRGHPGCYRHRCFPYSELLLVVYQKPGSTSTIGSAHSSFHSLTTPEVAVGGIVCRKEPPVLVQVYNDTPSDSA
jgi:hypothetical protein